DLFPEKIPKMDVLPEKNYPKGKRRARVALVAGCAQNVLEPEIGASTVSVLVRNGVEVVVPRGQRCCGALHWHSGDGEKARFFARENLAVFCETYDAVISNAAGCGSCLQDYPLVLIGDDKEEEARLFSKQVCDFSVFLDKIGFEPPPPAKRSLRIAYQDACHLRHAQKVSEAPRRILRAIPGVELIELAEPDICCGSAGLYNIEQPDIAYELGRKKVGHIIAADPDIVVSANIGCLSQLRYHLRNATVKPLVLHLAVVLHLAYSGNLGAHTNS
ncbi:MAG: (Fe-S)-binding protein, partial [Opitutales bacterium]